MKLRQDPLLALRKNPFVLAPMAGITDRAYRSFMRGMGSSLVVSELVSATGLVFDSGRTHRLADFGEDERPVGIQLFGDDVTQMVQAAKMIEAKGADFVDINFGCPVPKVVKKGGGAAMLKDLKQMEILLRAMKAALNIPLTIKIRTGWDEKSRNAHDVVQLAYDLGITWVAIHGRTRAQAYDGSADWDFIGEVKAKAKIPIIGNGDLVTPEMAVQRLKETRVDGVLIGRGALKNPFIFMDSMALWTGQGRDLSVDRAYSRVFLSLKRALTPHCDEKILLIQLKKFSAWFATGFPGAAQFRKSLFQCSSVEEVTEKALGFFSVVQSNTRETPIAEGFLMGGHG